MTSIRGIANDERTIENRFAGYVLPLVKMRRTVSGYDVRDILGTAFTFGQGTLVTCWHCVPRALDADEVVAVVRRSSGIQSSTHDEVYEVFDIGRDANGSDLALGSVGFRFDSVLPLGRTPPAWGSDVLACAYPLSDKELDVFRRSLRISLHSRVLRGYITRALALGGLGSEKYRRFELDMPVPAGASGSPLFSGSPFAVIGVLAAQHSATYKGHTTTFGHAVHLDVIASARAPATNGDPLSSHLKKWDPHFSIQHRRWLRVAARNTLARWRAR